MSTSGGGNAALEADRLVAGIDPDAVVAGAAADAGIDSGRLGDFVAAAAHAGRIGGRLEATTLEQLTRDGQAAAESNIRLAALVDLYLSAAWRMADSVRSVEHPDAAALGEVSAALARAADDAVAALCGGYETAQRQAIRRQEARRREFVDELLSGDPTRVADLAAGFGFNASGTHRVAIARTGRPLVDAGPVQGKLERDVLGRIGERDVIVATKDGDLVFMFPAELADPIPGLTGLLDEAEPGPWRVAVGTVAPGPEGVARSYREALETLVVADRLASPDRVVRAEDWSAHRLLLRDRAALAQVVQQVVGALSAARGGAEPLIETLEAYFAQGGNVTGMGRALHLSPRAISYRLASIRKLTGLDPAADRFTLETAVIGHRVLTD